MCSGSSGGAPAWLAEAAPAGTETVLPPAAKRAVPAMVATATRPCSSASTTKRAGPVAGGARCRARGSTARRRCRRGRAPCRAADRRWRRLACRDTPPGAWSAAAASRRPRRRPWDRPRSMRPGGSRRRRAARSRFRRPGAARRRTRPTCGRRPTRVSLSPCWIGAQPSPRCASTLPVADDDLEDVRSVAGRQRRGGAGGGGLAVAGQRRAVGASRTAGATRASRTTTIADRDQRDGDRRDVGARAAHARCARPGVRGERQHELGARCRACSRPESCRRCPR